MKNEEEPDASARSASGWEHVAFRSAAEIRAHPDFQAAHDCMVDGLAALYGNDQRLIRSLTEFEPAVAFMVVVCLDAHYDVGNPETSVTLARVQDALEMIGITGNRRIAHIINGMKLDGFLTRDVLPTDRRVQILRATEKMLAADREWLAVFHAPLALLYPEEKAFQAAVGRDPAYQRAYRRLSLNTLDFADKITRENPVISFFLSHSVGIRVLLALAAMVRGRSPPRTDPGFYTAAAERTGVSRTHVSNLMQEAADRGLVTLSSPSGQFVEMLPILEEALAQWIGDALSGVDLVATLAMAEFDPPSGQ